MESPVEGKGLKGWVAEHSPQNSLAKERTDRPARYTPLHRGATIRPHYPPDAMRPTIHGGQATW